MVKRILSISKHPAVYSSIILIVIMVTASFYMDKRVSKNVLATFDDNIHQNIVNTNEYIQSDIVEFEKRIRYLRNTAAIQNFVNNYPLDTPPINADLSGIEDVSATFRALMHEYDVIDQARILHFKTGQELVRMERNADQIVQVSNNNLQDKSARAYFIETTEIAQNEIYFSQINLNRENGEIQYPLKPTFRLAMQLVNNKQKKVITTTGDKEHKRKDEVYKLDKLIANNEVDNSIINTISCKYVHEGEIFIGSNLSMWPCCFLYDSKFKNRENIVEKLSEYTTGWNSLREHSIEEIMQHPWYDKVLEESWNPTHSKHMNRCIRTCAYNKAYQNVLVEQK